MFRAHSRFELPVPRFLQEPGSTERKFVLVEQCLNVPLWHLQVRPQAPPDSDEIQCSSLYLATQVEEVLKVLAQDWASSKVHVLLPAYMTASGAPALAPCLAIWEYRTIDGNPGPVWLFDTDAGSFRDPGQDGVEMKDLKQWALRWQAPALPAETPDEDVRP
jgi:hypothetical protein